MVKVNVKELTKLFFDLGAGGYSIINVNCKLIGFDLFDDKDYQDYLEVVNIRYIIGIKDISKSDYLEIDDFEGLGFWIDRENNDILYVQKIVLTNDYNEAIELAFKYNQIAIFDAIMRKEIRLDKIG